MKNRGVFVKKGGNKKQAREIKRQEILKLRNEGYTYQFIGYVFDISRQRIEQIIKKSKSYIKAEI